MIKNNNFRYIVSAKRCSQIILLCIVVASTLCSFSSCQKEAGIGGDASIKGSLFVKHYNTTFTQFISEYPGADVYVYLIFGNDISYDKRIKTTYDGKFEFKYLYKGDYTLYVYSLDSTLTVPGRSVPVIENITITDRKQTVDVGTINIFQ
ncbi:MAG: hypothetical protein H0W62_07860 [Chitinophagales bacterium]|nr:hypothetical protein [Chitinophagales bacterium]